MIGITKTAQITNSNYNCTAKHNTSSNPRIKLEQGQTIVSFTSHSNTKDFTVRDEDTIDPKRKAINKNVCSYWYEDTEDCDVKLTNARQADECTLTGQICQKNIDLAFYKPKSNSKTQNLSGLKGKINDCEVDIKYEISDDDTVLLKDLPEEDEDITPQLAALILEYREEQEKGKGIIDNYYVDNMQNQIYRDFWGDSDKLTGPGMSVRVDDEEICGKIGNRHVSLDFTKPGLSFLSFNEGGLKGTIGDHEVNVKYTIKKDKVILKGLPDEDKDISEELACFARYHAKTSKEQFNNSVDFFFDCAD